MFVMANSNSSDRIKYSANVLQNGKLENVQVHYWDEYDNLIQRLKLEVVPKDVEKILAEKYESEDDLQYCSGGF